MPAYTPDPPDLSRYRDPRARESAARLWAVYCEAWESSPIEGRCTLANRTAAQRSGLSLATVKRRLREWREWGWVLRETRARTVKGLDGRWRTCEQRGHPRAWQASSFTARLLTPPTEDHLLLRNDCRFRRTTTREADRVGHGLGGRESSGGRSGGSGAGADGGVVVGSGPRAVRRVPGAGRRRVGVQPRLEAEPVPDLRRARGDRGGSFQAAARVAFAVGALVLLLAAPAQAWTTSGASVYGGCPGAWGDVCGGAGFAELGGSGGVLMGGLAPGTRIFIRYRGRTISAVKADWGTGGGAVGGFPRALDLPCSTAARLGIYDCVTWTGILRWKLAVRVKRARGWKPDRPRQRTTKAPR